MTENWGGDGPETRTRVMLSERAGRTRLEMTMTYPSREARDAALGTGMSGGMERSFERLDARLEREPSRSVPAPAEPA